MKRIQTTKMTEVLKHEMQERVMFAILGLLGIALLGTAFLSSEDDEPGHEENSFEENPNENRGTESNGVDLFLDGEDGELAIQSDTLIGGNGEDYLRAGVDDVMFGGAGADIFEAPIVGPAYIQDFEDEEVIIIPYSGSEPVVEFAAMDHGTMIFADGVPIVEVRGSYDFQDAIHLISREDDS